MKPSQRETRRLTRLINGKDRVCLSFPLHPSPLLPSNPSPLHPATPLVIHSVTLNLPMSLPLWPSDSASAHTPTHAALSLLIKTRHHPRPPQWGEGWGDSRRQMLWVKIFTQCFQVWFRDSARGRDGEGTHRASSNHCNFWQVLMSSVPVETDHLGHGEKSCAFHFSIVVFP